MATQLQVDASAGRNNFIIFDSTGVTTASASETNLLVNSTGEARVDANGFINLGSYAGGIGFLHFYESAGAAGTLKIYSGLTSSATGASEITGGVAITASTADTKLIAVLPQFLRITVTRSAGNITVKYRLICVKTGTM